MMSSSSPLTDLSPRPLLAAFVLCWREIVRFLRQRNRVVGALGQPLLFWLLFGVGLQRSFRMGDGPSTSFLEYYFPGTIVLILLFTAIFATISIIEDRREGFLQGVLVAPVPRWSMVLGKVLGGALLALLQAAIFLVLSMFLQVNLTLAGIVQLIGFLLLAAVALTSLGFTLAWCMESTQGFHAIMSLVLMPMWLLSGAFFPIPAATAGSDFGQLFMHWCMRINPVTYCVAGVRELMYARPAAPQFWEPSSLAVCWLVTFLFALLTFAAAWRVSARRVTGDLL